MGLMSQMRTANATEASVKMDQAMLNALVNLNNQTNQNIQLQQQILAELKGCHECLQKLIELEERREEQVNGKQ